MFDVILPTIGRPSLNDAIDSVIEQSFPEWTLLVVFDKQYVDGDTAREICADYTDIRIQWCNLYPGPTVNNWSGTDARNLAIESCSSRWISYIDDDDVWMPNHLETLKEMSEMGHNMLHTRGAMVQYKHVHASSGRRVRKRVSTHIDPATVGMAHTREIFYKTPCWQAVPNHDHVIWQDMLSAGGSAITNSKITYEFLR